MVMKDLFNYTLVQIGTHAIRISSVIYLFGFILMVIILLQVIRRLIYRAKNIDIARKHAIYSLIKYVVLIFTILIGFQLLGFKLSLLLAGSAALLVGLGLGLQSLFSDFVSGIILLADSSVKVNDIIEVNNLVCKVQTINLRTTTVLTRDDKYIILPNSVLTKNQIINWTHSEVSSRFEVNVSVDYSSDVNLVMRIIKEAAEQQDGILEKPQPFVRFLDYGESSLNFAIFFWAEEVFRVENIKSNLRVKIFEVFKSNNISVPFPQRVVHLKK